MDATPQHLLALDMEGASLHVVAISEPDKNPIINLYLSGEPSIEEQLKGQHIPAYQIRRKHVPGTPAEETVNYITRVYSSSERAGIDQIQQEVADKLTQLSAIEQYNGLSSPEAKDAVKTAIDDHFRGLGGVRVPVQDEPPPGPPARGAYAEKQEPPAETWAAGENRGGLRLAVTSSQRGRT